ncbi:hypothetical protein FQZ97_928650 [compost metagenome]
MLCNFLSAQATPRAQSSTMPAITARLRPSCRALSARSRRSSVPTGTVICKASMPVKCMAQMAPPMARQAGILSN